MEIFVQRMKELREARGLSPAQVARGIKVTTQKYLRWERGLAQRGIGMLLKIAVFYNVSADYLVGLKFDDC
jgi:transcriptional regulator with XRE-family HTH domain